ncbi:MAG: hypothetical protein KDK96_00300 [Chlamydiia bacterium]|nr:hypothetical protein [Chlamydiia bacterium]
MAISAAQALISGPSRAMTVIAAGTTMVLGAEIGLRGLLTLSSLLQTGKLPDDYQFREQSWVSKNVIDFRTLTRNKSMDQVAREFAKAALATIVLSEVVFQLFGAPVRGINLIGKFVGVQMSNHGIYDVVKRMEVSDWTKFFHQPAV